MVVLCCCMLESAIPRASLASWKRCICEGFVGVVVQPDRVSGRGFTSRLDTHTHTHMLGTTLSSTCSPSHPLTG